MRLVMKVLNSHLQPSLLLMCRNIIILH